MKFTAFDAEMLWKSDMMWAERRIHRTTQLNECGGNLNVWTQERNAERRRLILEFGYPPANVNYKSMLHVCDILKVMTRMRNQPNISHFASDPRSAFEELRHIILHSSTNTIQQNQIILISLRKCACIIFFIQTSFHVCQENLIIAGEVITSFRVQLNDDGNELVEKLVVRWKGFVSLSTQTFPFFIIILCHVNWRNDDDFQVVQKVIRADKTFYLKMEIFP